MTKTYLTISFCVFTGMLLIMGAILGVATASQIECVSFVNAYLADVATGISIPTTGLPNVAISSPDEQHQAQIVTANVRTPYLTLDNELIALSVAAHQVYFSQDSRWLVYQGYSLTANQPEIGVVDIPRAHQHTLDLSTLNLAFSPTLYSVSPDAHYLILTGARSQQQVLIVLTLPDFQVAAEYRIGSLDDYSESWSSDSNGLGFFNLTDAGYQLNILWLDTLQLIQIPLSLYFYYADLQFTWSPDNRSVAVQYQQNIILENGDHWNHGVAVITEDGRVYEQAALFNHSFYTELVWSDDSRWIQLWRGVRGNQVELARFYPANGRYETVVEDVIDIGVYSPDKRRLAVQVHRNGIAQLEIMNIDGSDVFVVPHTTFSRKRHYYLMRWSPDGQTLVATNGYSLLWTDAINTNRISAFRFVRTFTWLENSLLLYVGGGFADEQVGLIDTGQNHHQILTDSMQYIDLVQTSPTRISFRWQNQQGDSGVDVFSPMGERLMHIELAGAVSMLDDLGTASIFWSPDGTAVLLRIGAQGDQLQLVTDSGQHSQVLSVTNLIPTYQSVAWSHDSQQLALATVDAQSELAVYVLDKSGTQAAFYDTDIRIANSPLMIQWTDCR